MAKSRRLELKSKLDHVGILVEKLDDQVIKFYQEALGCGKAKFFHVKNADEEINYAYLPFPKGDNYVKLLAPVRGPSKEYMNKKGPGALFEICVEVDSIDEFYDEMRKKDITLCDPMGVPLASDQKWCSIPGDDNKYAYMPTDRTYGTTIEILERSTWTRGTYWKGPSES